MHTPVLLHEAVNGLAIKPDGIYVDGTFGRGGHSRLILTRLGRKGQLIAFDKDPVAVIAGKTIEDERFFIKHSSFSQMQFRLREMGIARIDGVVLDLGISSPQLAEASRGFSFRSEGPLDMRMDTSCGQTAAEWLASVTEEQLGKVIREYGEERYARQIARAIITARVRQPIVNTLQLAGIISAVVRTRQRQRENMRHPATRTFQAIRVYLNQELEELISVLPQCLELLNPSGRLVVISFHSLEDRIAKRFMRASADSDELPRSIPLMEKDLHLFSKQKLKLIGKAIRPCDNELVENVRARSAVMRVAERIA